MAHQHSKPVVLHTNYYTTQPQYEKFSSDDIVEQHCDVNVKELMVRFAQGVPLGVQDNGLIYESDLVKNLSVDEGAMSVSDLTDIDRIKNTVQLANKRYEMEQRRLALKQKKQEPKSEPEK